MNQSKSESHSHHAELEFRIEKDSLGELKVPKEALWGAQTQRAIQNFPISHLKMPKAFIQTLGLIKSTAAEVNQQLKLLEPPIAQAIQKAANEIAEGKYENQFPIDIFQTGSGTSTNMNANEVIAHLASSYANMPVNPNDHVNMCQSSNDVIPTAIHVSASLLIQKKLIPALQYLANTLEDRAQKLNDIVKTGRTHLMDAMPLTFKQEISGWKTQILQGIERLQTSLPRLQMLALGGTAVGTGINAHPEFGKRVATLLSQKTQVSFATSSNYFESLSCQDAAVEISGQLRVIAISFMKIANDLRWMNSGPLTGLREISLPTLQPGSSIMPGKVNPVIPEAICMLSAQVIGNDATISISGLSGNFQLNVMLPVIAYNLLQSIELLTEGAHVFADKAISGFTINESHIAQQLSKNPILITALNPVIGYEKGAEIAKRAYQEGRPILDVAKEMTNLTIDELKRLLDTHELTRGGIKS